MIARKRFWIPAVLLAAIAPALMAPSGGYPSNPIFNLITFANGVFSGTLTGGTFAGTHTGTFSGASSGTFAGTTISGTTGAFSGQLTIPGGAGCTTPDLVFANSSTTGLATAAVGELDLCAGGAGVIQMAMNGSGVNMGSATGGTKGVGTLNAVGLFVNGVAVAAGVRNSYGGCAGSTGTLLAAYQSANVGNCTRSSTGVYIVNFTSAYTTNPPICTFVANGLPGGTIGNDLTFSQPTATTSAVTVNTVTTTTGAIDTTFLFSCVGT